MNENVITELSLIVYRYNILTKFYDRLNLPISNLYFYSVSYVSMELSTSN